MIFSRHKTLKSALLTAALTLGMSLPATVAAANDRPASLSSETTSAQSHWQKGHHYGSRFNWKRLRKLRTRPEAERSTCAGIRGNGQNLFAHYGALARHVEEYGAVKCAAGGSSGSITTFLMESMWANPSVHFCQPYRRCNKRTRDARYALMLKSVIGQTEAGIFQDVNTISAILSAVTEQDIMALLEGPTPMQGVEAFERVLRDLGPIINPEVIELLVTSPDPVFHATDIITGLQKGVQFIVDDPAVFLRTSVVNFDQFANLVGVVGSFYASYGPSDDEALQNWLRECARPSVGLTWEETAVLMGPGGQTCGEAFTTLFNDYREAFASGDFKNRVDDPVGRFMPAFGVTGVLTGEAIPLWEEARAAWIAAEPIPFEPNFDDVGVGCWGKPRELRTIKRELKRNFDDLVSEQFVPLGKSSWREVLKSSPAEPGFSPAVPLQIGVVSVGGWADPLRVIPLEALGARKTIAINRLGGVGGFTEQVTELLNASEDDLNALYSTTDPESSFYIGLDIATGVWCTDWDGQGSVPNPLFNDAYNSPLITDNGRFLNPRNGYPNVGPDFQIQGCVPGLGSGTAQLMVAKESW